LQIVYGLLCAPDGCPVAIEVFDGNTGDPSTLAPQIEKLKQRFHLDHVVLVGDRGMITQARITEDLKSAGLDWITALRAPAIKDLLNSGACSSPCSISATPAPRLRRGMLRRGMHGLHHIARFSG
jgi:transposase